MTDRLPYCLIRRKFAENRLVPIVLIQDDETLERVCKYYYNRMREEIGVMRNKVWKKRLVAATLTIGLLLTGITLPADKVQAADADGIQQFVTRMYQVCFDREPDADGLKDWSNRLATGQESGAQVARGFIFSDEFRNMNLCNEHYVESMYSAFFGRPSDEAGKKDWMNRLANGQTRGAVMTGFINSREFHNLCQSYGIQQGSGDWTADDITVIGSCVKDATAVPTEGIRNFVTRLYTKCLQRTADSDGVDDWSNQLAKGATGSKVAAGFVFSAEYQNKKASNEEYVKMLYRTMLDREADADGLEYWLWMLNGGVSREQVFDGFLQSTEFAGLCKNAGIILGDPVSYTEVKHGDQDHNWRETDSREEVDCFEGVTRYTKTYECPCGETKTEETMAHECDWQWVRDDNPNHVGCTMGYVILQYICRTHGTKTPNFDIIYVDEHEREEHIIEPTCERQGVVEIVCKKCGLYFPDEYRVATNDKYPDGGGNGHKFEDTTRYVDDHAYLKHTCTVCGYSYQDKLY